MKCKKLYNCLLACLVFVGLVNTPVQAAGTRDEINRNVYLSQLEHEHINRYRISNDYVIPRVTGNIDVTIGADGIAFSDERFLLEAGKKVEINCTYSPAFAEVLFGLLDEDGVFYSVKSSGGSIRKTISVDVRGKYSFCVKNNPVHEITVRGFVY